MSNKVSTNEKFDTQSVAEFEFPTLIVTAPRFRWFDWYYYSLWKSIFATIDPQNRVFINPTLSRQNILDGYRLRENPLGIGMLWRVTASGRVHPDDLKQCERQKKTIYSYLSVVENEVSQQSQGSSNAGLGLLTSGSPLYADAGMTMSDAGYVTVNKPEPSTFEKFKNYLSQNYDLLKLEAESLTDTALGKLVIDNLRNTFSIVKQSAPGLGPAGILEVRVDTTPGSVITLKGVAKVFGGVVSLGQTSYDVYVDYKTFGFTENFAKVAAADIGTTVVVALGSGAAVTLGAPVIAVSVAGGFTIYYVNQKFINPLKESLEGQQ